MLARNMCGNKLVREIGHTVAHNERDRGDAHSLVEEIFRSVIMKRAHPLRNRSFLKIPAQLYDHGLQQLELMEKQAQGHSDFAKETIAVLKYAYCKDGGYYRLVDKREQDSLNNIAYFFNEILLANRIAIQSITLEEIASEFLVWVRSYWSYEISNDAALRLALHIAISLHGTKIKTRHRDVVLVLTDNKDKRENCTIGINAWHRSTVRIPDIQTNGNTSLTNNTIPLITSQIPAARARCDLRTDLVLEIDSDNCVVSAQE
jgi:hypothetical protein